MTIGRVYSSSSSTTTPSAVPSAPPQPVAAAAAAAAAVLPLSPAAAVPPLSGRQVWRTATGEPDVPAIGEESDVDGSDSDEDQPGGATGPSAPYMAGPNLDEEDGPTQCAAAAAATTAGTKPSAPPLDGVDFKEAGPPNKEGETNELLNALNSLSSDRLATDQQKDKLRKLVQGIEDAMMDPTFAFTLKTDLSAQQIVKTIETLTASTSRCFEKSRYNVRPSGTRAMLLAFRDKLQRLIAFRSSEYVSPYTSRYRSYKAPVDLLQFYINEVPLAKDGSVRFKLLDTVERWAPEMTDFGALDFRKVSSISRSLTKKIEIIQQQAKTQLIERFRKSLEGKDHDSIWACFYKIKSSALFRDTEEYEFILEIGKAMNGDSPRLYNYFNQIKQGEIPPALEAAVQGVATQCVHRLVDAIRSCMPKEQVIEEFQKAKNFHYFRDHFESAIKDLPPNLVAQYPEIMQYKKLLQGNPFVGLSLLQKKP
jgi:hypothetical protein